MAKDIKEACENQAMMSDHIRGLQEQIVQIGKERSVFTAQ